MHFKSKNKNKQKKKMEIIRIEGQRRKKKITQILFIFELKHSEEISLCVK